MAALKIGRQNHKGYGSTVEISFCMPTIRGKKPSVHTTKVDNVDEICEGIKKNLNYSNFKKTVEEEHLFNVQLFRATERVNLLDQVIFKTLLGNLYKKPSLIPLFLGIHGNLDKVLHTLLKSYN